MPFEVKSNNAQADYNLLQLPQVGSGDPAYQNRKVLMKFRTSFLVADLATMDRVVIDGATKSFTATRATTTAAGLAGIKTEIEAIMNTLLGVNDGKVYLSTSGTRVFITTSYSELKIETCGLNGNLVPFIPIDANIVGTVAANVASPIIHCSLNSAGTHYKVRIKPICGKTISAFNIDFGGSTDEYDSVWPAIPSYTLPTGGVGVTTLEGGFVCFDVLKATGDAGITASISITPTGGSAIVYSQTLKLLDYNGQ